jgi:hypothetical protein
MAKFTQDFQYNPGTRINEYPEMNAIFPISNSDKISQYFFASTTIGYISSLTYVIHRLDIPNELLIIPFVVLFGYFSWPVTDDPDFITYQHFTRLIMFASLFFTTNSMIILS